MRHATKLMAAGLTVLGAGLLLLGAVGCKKDGGAGGTKVKLLGSGSTFVQPMMGKWVDAYTREKGGSINYQGGGSGAGITQMTKKAADFGCTDAFLNEEQLGKASAANGPVVHVPVVMGGIVPAYNLEGVEKPLNFTGEVLAEIFLGKVKKWNDAKLAALNEGVKLPDQKISVVVRGDSSGSTNIFTDYLSKVSPEFKKQVGAGTAVQWPSNVGTAESGNPAVAGFIGKNPGSIGYTELTFALNKGIKFGAVKNKAGKFVLASPKSVSQAAASLAEVPDDLRFTLTDTPGDGSYPISGTTWAVMYVKQPADSGPALVDFFTWVLHEGQKYTEELHYAPVPENIVRLAEKKLQTVGK